MAPEDSSVQEAGGQCQQQQGGWAKSGHGSSPWTWPPGDAHISGGTHRTPRHEEGHRLNAAAEG